MLVTWAVLIDGVGSTGLDKAEFDANALPNKKLGEECARGLDGYMEDVDAPKRADLVEFVRKCAFSPNVSPKFLSQISFKIIFFFSFSNHRQNFDTGIT